MAEIRLEWLDTSTHIIVAHYPKGYTWDDYHTTIDHLVDTIGDNDDIYYFINVYEAGAMLPRSSPIAHHKRSQRSINVGFVVYVTKDPALKSTLRLFLKGINYQEHINYEFVDHVEEAVAMIEGKQSTSSS